MRCWWVGVGACLAVLQAGAASAAQYVFDVQLQGGGTFTQTWTADFAPGGLFETPQRVTALTDATVTPLPFQAEFSQVVLSLPPFLTSASVMRQAVQGDIPGFEQVLFLSLADDSTFNLLTLIRHDYYIRYEISALQISYDFLSEGDRVLDAPTLAGAEARIRNFPVQYEFYAVARDDYFRVDPNDADGAQQLISRNSREYFGTATLRAVPEPATWLLMEAGFGLAGAALRRRRPVSAAV